MLNKTMRYMIKLLMKQARNTEPAKLSKAEALIKHYLMRAPGIHGLTTHPLLHKLSPSLHSGNSISIERASIYTMRKTQSQVDRTNVLT